MLNRQRARSIHFLAMWWFLLFILAHVTLVFITGARVNLNMMWAGVNDASWSDFAVFYSLADSDDGGRYYDVHRTVNMRHALTMLAIDMNGAPVSVLHGAPVRRERAGVQDGQVDRRHRVRAGLQGYRCRARWLQRGP